MSCAFALRTRSLSRAKPPHHSSAQHSSRARCSAKKFRKSCLDHSISFFNSNHLLSTHHHLVQFIEYEEARRPLSHHGHDIG